MDIMCSSNPTSNQDSLAQEGYSYKHCKDYTNPERILAKILISLSEKIKWKKFKWLAKKFPMGQKIKGSLAELLQ